MSITSRARELSRRTDLTHQQAHQRIQESRYEASKLAHNTRWTLKRADAYLFDPHLDEEYEHAWAASGSARVAVCDACASTFFRGEDGNGVSDNPQDHCSACVSENRHRIAAPRWLEQACAGVMRQRAEFVDARAASQILVSANQLLREPDDYVIELEVRLVEASISAANGVLTPHLCERLFVLLRSHLEGSFRPPFSDTRWLEQVSAGAMHQKTKFVDASITLEIWVCANRLLRKPDGYAIELEVRLVELSAAAANGVLTPHLCERLFVLLRSHLEGSSRPPFSDTWWLEQVCAGAMHRPFVNADTAREVSTCANRLARNPHEFPQELVELLTECVAAATDGALTSEQIGRLYVLLSTHIERTERRSASS